MGATLAEVRAAMNHLKGKIRSQMEVMEAELGKEQFLCPVLGESVPRLDNAMCKPSYVSYETKTLRIALMGPPPEFILNRDKTIDGINIRLIEILRERLNFIEEIVIPRGPRPLINMVS